MKRRLRVFMVFLLAFLLAGCGGRIPPSGETVWTEADTEQSAGNGTGTSQRTEADADKEQSAGFSADTGRTAGSGADTGQTAGSAGDGTHTDSGGAGNASGAGDSTAAPVESPDSGTKSEESPGGPGGDSSGSSGSGDASSGPSGPGGDSSGSSGSGDASSGPSGPGGDSSDPSGSGDISSGPSSTEGGSGMENDSSGPAEDGTYTTKEDVAEYIYLYGHLPPNFITKKEAEKLGWKGGSLEPYAPGMCIGGNRFGNYEGLLPDKKGRSYTECDIDTLGANKRGAKRIVFSNDGLIYYTEDHYNTFELLYGEPEEE